MEFLILNCENRNTRFDNSEIVQSNKKYQIHELYK